MLSLPSQTLDLYLIDIETVIDRLSGQNAGKNPILLNIVVATWPILISMMTFGLLIMLVLWLAS